ncbi:MAG: hypothetical protein R6V85_03155 [Polyangia bacterium]
MISPRVVLTVIRKELIQTLRDRRMLPILLIVPLVQVTIFGFAVNLDLQRFPAVISDRDSSRASRELIGAMDRAESFELLEVVRDNRAASDAVWKGEAELLVAVDGSDANTAVRAGQELSRILSERVERRQRQKIETTLAARGSGLDGIAPRLRLVPRAWFNPRLRTAVFLVPGVLALVLTVITMVRCSGSAWSS